MGTEGARQRSGDLRKPVVYLLVTSRKEPLGDWSTSGVVKVDLFVREELITG